LIVTSDTTLAEHLVHELRTLDWIAVAVDDCDIGLEMMEVVDFSLVMVDITRAQDWMACRRLVEAKRSSVVVVTSFADDERYRTFAFQTGAVACVCRLCAVGGQLCEMLRRLQRGERCIELLGAAHGPLDRAKLA
jgi:DNA-binding response OmpR family regulator